MLTLLELVKSAVSVSATVPASESAKAHADIDSRVHNKIMPWRSGRKPMPKRSDVAEFYVQLVGSVRKRASVSEADRQRHWKMLLKKKRRSTPPSVIKSGGFNYSDLGKPVPNAGAMAFNHIVHQGLQSMPRNTLGSQLGRGLKIMREEQPAQSAQDSGDEPFWSPFFQKVWKGDLHGAVDAYNDTERQKSWSRRVGEGVGAAGQGALHFVPGIGWKARAGLAMAGAELPGPSFEQRMIYAPLATAKAVTHDIPEISGNVAKTLRANREAAETDPAKQRVNSFNRWLRDYRGRPDVLQANMPGMFPDLWARHQRGERF
jgi:hypothetical protein